MSRRLIALLVGAFVFGGAAGAVEAITHEKGKVIARVKGCPSEDSCTVDYRPSGTWVIKRVTP